MREDNPQHRRALAVLMTATALIATPVLAQETTPAPAQTAPAPAPVAPPRVVPTVPSDDGVTSSSQAARPGRAVGDSASSTPVNPEAAQQAAAEDAERRAAARAAKPAAKAPARPAVRAAARPAPAPAAAPTRAAAPAGPVDVPAGVASPTPQAPAPSPSPSPSATATPTPAATATPAAQSTTAAASTAETDTATTSGGFPTWAIALIGVLVVAGLAFFLLRRRRDEGDYVEPVYAPEPVVQAEAQPMTIEPVAAPVVAPEPVVAPVAAAPVAAVDEPEVVAAPATPDDATVSEAEAEDVAALTAAAPVSDRPWLEFALRPIRAGTNVDEALVEIELTVGNAGQVTAQDVRIATYMLANGQGDDMTQLLANPPANGEIEPVSIAPGEGTKVEATLAVLKAQLGSTFEPIVVVDARYVLHDGSEGRTSAAFVVGRIDEGSDAFHTFDTGTPSLHENIEARLYREPEHA